MHIALASATPRIVEYARQVALAGAAVDHARLIVALARYHDDRHAYPAALRELVPAYVPSLPIDPLTNTPSSYRAQEGGYDLFRKMGFGAGDEEVVAHVRQGASPAPPISKTGENAVK